MRSAAAAATLVFVLLGSVGRASAQGQVAIPTIRVEGEASETFLPDKAVLSLGVVTERPRAADAASENSRAVRAVIDAVKAAGIEPRAIESASVSLEPLFKQADGEPTITGFRASNRLQVEVVPPERAGLLAGTLIEKGVNAITGIAFSSNVNVERADRLRGLAIRDARRKAETYVGALGLKLGRVIDIAPSGDAPRPVGMKVMSPARAMPEAVPLEPGEQTETSAVSVTWEISD